MRRVWYRQDREAVLVHVDEHEAFDLHRKAPHLAAYRLRREKEGLTDGAPEVELFRSFTE